MRLPSCIFGFALGVRDELQALWAMVKVHALHCLLTMKKLACCSLNNVHLQRCGLGVHSSNAVTRALPSLHGTCCETIVGGGGARSGRKVHCHRRHGLPFRGPFTDGIFCGFYFLGFRSSILFRGLHFLLLLCSSFSVHLRHYSLALQRDSFFLKLASLYRLRQKSIRHPLLLKHPPSAESRFCTWCYGRMKNQKQIAKILKLIDLLYYIRFLFLPLLL